MLQLDGAHPAPSCGRYLSYVMRSARVLFGRAAGPLRARTSNGGAPRKLPETCTAPISMYPGGPAGCKKVGEVKGFRARLTTESSITIGIVFVAQHGCSMNHRARQPILVARDERPDRARTDSCTTLSASCLVPLVLSSHRFLLCWLDPEAPGLCHRQRKRCNTCLRHAKTTV